MTAIPGLESESVELPTGVFSLNPPPDKIIPQGISNVFATVIPMMGSVGAMVLMQVINAMNTENPNSGTGMFMGAGMIVSMIGMVGVNIYRQTSTHKRNVRDSRQGYIGYLAEKRAEIRRIADTQRRYFSWQLPDPDSLVFIADQGSRLWERPLGSRTLNVRLGRSTQDLSMKLEEYNPPANVTPDPVCHSAISRFIAVHSGVDDVPFGVSLGDYSGVEVSGDHELARAQVRAMVMQLATLVSPAGLRIAVLCPPDARGEWEWAKWLPHVRSQESSDAIGPARMISSDAGELLSLLGKSVTERPAFQPRTDSTAWPHVLVVADRAELPPGAKIGSREGLAGVTVVTLPQTASATRNLGLLRVAVKDATRAGDPPNVEVQVPGAEPMLGTADSMGVRQAEAIARRMTHWSEDELPDVQVATDEAKADPKRSADLMELLGVGDIRDFDPEAQWVRRLGRDRLRVPFGITPEGVPVLIDIKESAQQGMGPHGLLIGATGSGKSEVLRTVVLALALTHSPEQLNFVLVDFKGGATFAGMSDLPHVSAMISNLESELSLVDRMQDALQGEMTRRMEQLRKAGNYANVTDYEADRVAGKHDYAPLPALFIILDEFSEMLSAKPEFIETFVMIGRLGRSVAIHLLLSSQRLEEGRLRGLDSHLSYRIGLRTFSAAESRQVLGVPSAYELPSIPGVGFLKAGTDTMIRFRASYVAAPPPARKGEPKKPKAVTSAVAQSVEILPFTSSPQQRRVEPVAISEPVRQETGPIIISGDERWEDMTEMDIAVERMKGKGMPAHQVWLPPLDVPDTLDELMPDLAVDPELGLVSPQWRALGGLRVPLGTIDLPLEQRRDVLQFDFSGAGGHMAIIGGPLTGKSTMLRSIVMALSLTQTPLEVQFYILDFGGGTFASFDGGTHIAGVATRDQPDVVNRMIAEIEGIVNDREKFFRANRIDSIDTYRRGRAEGKYDDGYGDVFLVVDGWATVRSDFDVLEQRIQILAARALSFGVHLLLATGRWMDIRQQLRDVIGSKFELRMGDPSDSDIDRKLAKLVPEGRPGRGIEVTGHHALVCLPRADGDPNVETLSQGVQSTLARIGEAWEGKQRPPKLKLLPLRLDLDDLRALEPDSDKILIGVEETRMGPFHFDPKSESHMFLLGDAKTGKSNFLRSIAHEVMRLYTPKEAKIIALDLRRSLLGEIPSEYLFGYQTTKDEATKYFSDLAEYLRTRLPGKDVTPEQLRDRSWWSGAEVWLLVDDYDLVATQTGNPISALQPLVAQASDVGLHIIITRRMGGASRGLYEPILQAMQETGTTSILLSGNPDDGPIIGRVKAIRSVPGRAQIIHRDQGLVISQLAWTQPKM
ncbi:MAG: type VII secretion protein EccCa [Propionibacteriaceae bacterium]|jgi:S-DNA-T family DNA segregation ATPase FtsK/SpoIIIE|nr:type VII secretion protein EccCa [Propionibacteriaceae bacterium]